MMTPSSIESMQTELGAALPLWGLSSRSTVSFLSHSENTTFLARDPASGRRLVLRVQRTGYHASVEIRSELAWIAPMEPPRWGNDFCKRFDGRPWRDRVACLHFVPVSPTVRS